MFKKNFRVIALMLCIVLMMGFFVVNTEAVSTVLLAVQGAIVDGNLVKFSGINGIGMDAGVSAINVVKCKFDATAAPTGNNDVDEGYTVGSRWLDVTNDKSYICLDNTDGAAVWHLDVVGPGSSTDHAIVRWDSTTGRTTLNSVVTVSDAGVVAGGEWQGTVISPVYGGTGIANNVASTITISGNFAITITVTNVTAITLPTAGIVVSDNNACTDLEGTLLSIGAGTLNVTIPEDHITATMLKDDNAPADEDFYCYELTGTTGHWYSRVEVGIGLATSITDGIIKEADLDADAVAVGDILTYDDGGVDFLWKTKAELSIASSGANVDITSILNAALYIGRDADNTISFITDDKIIFKTAGVANMEILSTGEVDFNAFSAVFTEAALTSGTAIAWDLGNSNKATLTAAHNFTITITAPSGAMNAQLIITQDGTGSRVMDEIVTQTDTAIATTDVHADTEIIDLVIDIPTGARIRFKTSAADLPEPLVVDTIYWAIRSSENHIKVATTKANAIAGTEIDITDQGTGTHTVQQLVKWTGGSLGVLSTAAGSEDILGLTYKTGDEQWYAQLAEDFY